MNGMRALLVAPPDRTTDLKTTLIRGGFAVDECASGLYAITQLERTPPEVLVAVEGVADLDLDDLRDIVNEDPNLRAVALILVGTPPAGFEPARHRHTLPADASPEAVVQAAYRCAVAAMRMTQVRAGEAVYRQGINGSLEIFGLLELLQSLAQSNKSGLLYLNIDDDEGEIYLRDGDVVHAFLRGATGMGALRAAVAYCEAHPSTEFIFEALPDKGQALDRTIHMSADQLLIELAVERDHAERAAKRELERGTRA